MNAFENSSPACDDIGGQARLSSRLGAKTHGWRTALFDADKTMTRPLSQHTRFVRARTTPGSFDSRVSDSANAGGSSSPANEMESPSLKVSASRACTSDTLAQPVEIDDADLQLLAGGLR